jgi:hypothetical protein
MNTKTASGIIPVLLLAGMLGCASVSVIVNPYVVERLLDSTGQLPDMISQLLGIASGIAGLITLFYAYVYYRCRRGASRLPDLLAGLTVSILVVIVTFSLAEVGFRFMFDDLLKKDIYAFNEFFGMNYTKPNLQKRLATSEYDVLYRTNSVGLRDDGELQTKVPGEKRVLIVGDSFIQAAQVELGKTASALLEQLLNSRSSQGSQVTVLNVARSGWTSSDMLQFLSYNISKFEPHLVIVMTYVGNDIIELMMKHKRVQQISTDGFINSVRRHVINEKNPSHLVRFLFERFSAKAEWPMGRPNQPFFSPYLGNDAGNVFMKTYSADIDEAFDIFFSDILSIKNVCDKSGANFALAIAPTKEQVHPNALAEVLEFMQLDETDFDMEKPQRIIRDFANERHLIVIDLLPEMRAVGHSEQLYFSIDSHWNAAGNRLVAEVLSQPVERLLFDGTVVSSIN